jgi:hypothetical protein
MHNPTNNNITMDPRGLPPPYSQSVVDDVNAAKMEGWFVFNVGDDKFSVPFRTMKYGTGVIVLLNATEIRPPMHKHNAIRHLMPLFSNKAEIPTSEFIEFHVTMDEFINFKQNVLNRGVEWEVKPRPHEVPQQLHAKGIDRLIPLYHRVKDSLSRVSRGVHNRKVVLHGTWTTQPEQAGGRKRRRGGSGRGSRRGSRHGTRRGSRRSH